MTRTLKKKLGILEGQGKVIFWSLTCLLLLTVSFYVYLVNTAALNGVRFGKVQQEVAELEARVSELDAHYLSLKQSITLAAAYEKGFEDVRDITFITAPKVGIVANSNEI